MSSAADGWMTCLCAVWKMKPWSSHYWTGRLASQPEDKVMVPLSWCLLLGMAWILLWSSYWTIALMWQLGPRTTNEGITSLISAAQQGHASMVALLLDNGADCRATKMEGCMAGASALSLAAFNGHESVVKVLLHSCIGQMCFTGFQWFLLQRVIARESWSFSWITVPVWRNERLMALLLSSRLPAMGEPGLWSSSLRVEQMWKLHGRMEPMHCLWLPRMKMFALPCFCCTMVQIGPGYKIFTEFGAMDVVLNPSKDAASSAQSA